MPRRRLALSVLVVALLAVACGPPALPPTALPVAATTAPTPVATATRPPVATPAATTPPAVTASGPIRIGATGPFNGPLAGIGKDFLNAVRLAADEWNAKGGLSGRKIEVVEGDDSGDPQKAATVAEKFASDPAVVAVIGPLTNGAADSALPIYEKSNLAIISPSATASWLAEQGYQSFHRVVPSDADQAPADALFLVHDLKAKAVAMIDDRSTYGVDLAGQVEASLRRLDSGVKVTRYSVAPEEDDFTRVLIQIQDDRPDLLFLPLSSPDQGVALVEQAKRLGLDVKYLAPDSWYDRGSIIEEAAGVTSGIYVSNLGPNLSRLAGAADFVKTFQTRYNATPTSFAAQGYEATNLALAAIQKIGVKDGKVERKSVRDAISGTRDYRGILGIPITFAENGDLEGGPVFIFQVMGTDFEPVRVVWADR